MSHAPIPHPCPPHVICSVSVRDMGQQFVPERHIENAFLYGLDGVYAERPAWEEIATPIEL